MRSSLMSARRFAIIGTSVLTSVALLSGCSAVESVQDSLSGSSDAASTSSAPGKDKPAETTTKEKQPTTDSGLPADTFPEVQADGECPYLDSQWIAETNGQRVTTQGIDNRFDTPACLIWSYPEEPQAVVVVRKMADEDAAIEVVDWAAPIKKTEPAEEPAGWSGGRGVVDERAVYAVQKGDVAVAVWSNQLQTVKAELIAKEAIKNLGL